MHIKGRERLPTIVDATIIVATTTVGIRHIGLRVLNVAPHKGGHEQRCLFGNTVANVSITSIEKSCK